MFPFNVFADPSMNVALSTYAYASIGCGCPLNLPSHPLSWLVVSKTSWPQRLNIFMSSVTIAAPRT